MNQKQIPDAFGLGFFECATDTPAQRVGRGLLRCAEQTTLSFEDCMLPFAACCPPGCGLYYQFGNGVCDGYNLDALVEKFPEYAEQIRKTAEQAHTYLAPMQSWTTERGRALTEAGCGWGGNWGGHGNPDYGRLLTEGTDGIRQRCRDGLAKNPGAAAFYDGCMMALAALDTLGDRFRVLAQDCLQTETDPEKAAMYRELAEAFAVIPRRPAYDFASAVFCFWMCFSFDGIDSPGLLDRFLGSYYEHCDPAKRWALLSRLWDAFSQTRTWNVAIGGSDAEGRDTACTLTYDILRMAAEKKVKTPNLVLRTHANMPDDLWQCAIDALASGIGMPALYADETVKTGLSALGIPPQDCALYCLNGCNQLDIMGKSHMGLEDGEVNFAKCLELALSDGVDTCTGTVIGIRTGEAATFADYETLERAFFAQLDDVTRVLCNESNRYQEVLAALSPSPLRSCLIEGCLERGRDYRAGGPLYNHGQILAEGIADAADSLFAVKKLCFDEKRYTMEELLRALSANFDGHETLRQDFASCEKFGNDTDGVDTIAARLVNHFFDTLSTLRTYRGGTYSGGCSPYDRAAFNGRHTGALPEGRRRGEALFADSVGAVPGHDCNGPTALINSVLRYPASRSGSGFILNLKFERSLFTTPAGRAGFLALTKSFFGRGGQMLTATVVSRADLLDAKIHPERHGGLIVRVGGYSEYFVTLPEDLQDNVIARTAIGG